MYKILHEFIHYLKANNIKNIILVLLAFLYELIEYKL